ncbi:hypothetical protein [Peristeroidobacter soli]|uniref:hypothetical protein n=1 Tax=Peristeroidobacter soli TaxID=2497877 RepID=UPI00101C1BA5|nr:hypothetical protein [Peristeroidobacter soli]
MAEQTPFLATSNSGLPPGGVPPSQPPPRTLEETIEAVHTQLMEGRAMLHCLSELLLYSDDVDCVMHAEIAQAVAQWIADSAEQLDLMKLQPLIDELKRFNDESRDDFATYLPYQVREPTVDYRVA